MGDPGLPVLLSTQQSKENIGIEWATYPERGSESVSGNQVMDNKLVGGDMTLKLMLESVLEDFCNVGSRYMGYPLAQQYPVSVDMWWKA